MLLEFKQNIDGLTLVPSAGGAFEISVDGDKIYSKLETKEFPDFDAIVADVRGGE